MKKIILSLLGILSASTLLMAGCKDDGGQDSSTPSADSSSVEQITVSVDVTDSALTMDCFETRALEVETKNAGAIVWESSDPSIVAVDENGVLTANVKEGKATITAKCGDVLDTCEVTVLRKNAIPSFAVQTKLDLLKGSSYSISGIVTYNGIDVSAYATYGFNATSGEEGAVSVASESNKWTFTANEVGETQFTVYATIFGQTYADTVSVSVKEADVVYLVKGATLNGDVSELLIRKGLTEYAPMYTSNVEIYDKGVRVENSSLTWTVSDTNIAEIGQGGKLIGKKEGYATLSTTYKDTPVNVQVHVLKDRQYITAEGVQDVDLDVSIRADVTEYSENKAPVAGIRVYTSNAAKEVKLTLGETGVDYGSLISATADGKALDASMFEFTNGEVRASAMAFGTDAYGEKTLVFESELDDIIYNFTVKALLITKTISTLDEYRYNVPSKWLGDQVFGYYVLDSDIDFAGYGASVNYTTDWDYAHGFRGTFDGRNHVMKNYKPDNYGLMAQIGMGAVLKNLVFDNVMYVGSGAGSTSRSIFARGMGGATVENVVINLSKDSTPEDAWAGNGVGRGGILTHSTKGNTYKNVTINGQNHEIGCLIGVNEGESLYENVVVNNALVQSCTTNNAELLPGISHKGIYMTVTGTTLNGERHEYLIEKDGAFVTKDHVTIYVDGEKVKDEALGWTVADTGVAKIQDGKVVSVSEGMTTLSTAYQGVNFTVYLTAQIYDRVEIKSDAPATDVNLDLGIAYNASGNKSTYTANQTATASVTFEVESGKDYGEITGAMLDGIRLDGSLFSYANGTFTFNTSVFGVDSYGEKKLTVEMQQGETIYKFSAKVLLITKVLSAKADLESALSVRAKGHMVYGYYVLGGDIDFEGTAMNSVYANDWDHKTGFVATFDGRNYKLKNYKASTYGFISQVSDGAVIKNVTFDGVLRQSNEVVIARGMGYTTIENVTVNLAESADTSATLEGGKRIGVLAYGTSACKYVNVTVNAQGKTIEEVFTGEPDVKTTYENVVINASAVTYYYGQVSLVPEGITLNTGNAEA